MSRAHRLPLHASCVCLGLVLCWIYFEAGHGGADQVTTCSSRYRYHRIHTVVCTWYPLQHDNVHLYFVSPPCILNHRYLIVSHPHHNTCLFFGFAFICFCAESPHTLDPITGKFQQSKHFKQGPTGPAIGPFHLCQYHMQLGKDGFSVLTSQYPRVEWLSGA